jgi:ABC-type glycerol-3-phosphate transport system permease component
LHPNATGAKDGSGRLHWTDWASYAYLTLGIFLMFGPVVWLVLSSFKTEADLQRYPPTFLPYQQQTMVIEGYDDPLPLFRMTGGEYEGMVLAQVRRVGLAGADGRPRQSRRAAARRPSTSASRCRACGWPSRTTPSFSSASPSCAISGTRPSSP